MIGISSLGIDMESPKCIGTERELAVKSPATNFFKKISRSAKKKSLYEI